MKCITINQIIRISNVNLPRGRVCYVSKVSFQITKKPTLFDVTKKYDKPAPRIWREISTTNKIKEDKTKNQLNT